MSKPFPSRQDTSLMVALVVAAVMAGMSARQPDPAHRAGTETGGPDAAPVAQHRSPLIDYLDAVGAANATADPSTTTIATLLSP